MPDLALWNKCDNRCVMCTNPRGFPRQAPARYSLREQVRKLETALRGGRVFEKGRDGGGFLNLTGGEPTLHPELFKLLAYYRRRLPGTPITLLSHGRRFADADFTARFVRSAAPPFRVAVPLHGHCERAHDAVTRVEGSFAQTMAGLRNLFAARKGQDVEIRVVLHRGNAGLLGRLLRLLLRSFPDTSAYGVALMHYEIEGEAARNRRAVELRLSACAGEVGECAPLIRRFPRLELYHFPLCAVKPELRPLCRVSVPRSERVFPAACRRCAARAGCFGLMKTYRRRFGAGELAPLKA